MRILTAARCRLAWASLVATGLGGCAATPSPAPIPEQGAPEDRQPDMPPAPDAMASYESSGHAGMDRWRMDFASRAVAEGRSPRAIRAVLEDLKPLDLYLATTFGTAETGIDDQAEFNKPIWDYLDSAVSETRKATGARKLAANRALFDALEARFGVHREVLVAIWGMETSYGGFIGTHDAANTLANMAVEGRRRAFAEGELLALMKILERGEATREDLVSGWAGAMGQTQFMPSTFLAHAADFEGDGLKDIWSNPADALASAAQYLSNAGYRPGEPWGVEVRLPNGFDYRLLDEGSRRVARWAEAGLVTADGRALASLDLPAFGELRLPAGHRGPAFLLFKNYGVFKRYNNADSYALAVGLLAEGVAGRNVPRHNWPRDIEPLSVGEIKQLQAGLNRLGHGAGAVDGIIGPGTRGALRRFQASAGFIPDGFPTREMLTYVLGAAGR